MIRRVTMADIARQGGVHPTTVSLALRNHPSLPPETRQRIQALAAQMGYQRDPALSALIAYRRHSRPVTQHAHLAYITHWDTRWGWKDHPAHLAFFEGAQRKAHELGYQLEHFWLGEPGLTHRRLSRILYSRGITGLILASHRAEYDAPLDFDWPKFSAVKIDFCPRQQLLHMITNDQRTVMALAVRRARAAGYRRIGCIMPVWWDQFVDLSWSAGYLAEQQAMDAGDRLPILYYTTPPPPDPGAPLDFTVPREALADWHRQHRPDLIVSYAPFVYPALAALELVVPRDLAFADIFLAQPDGALAGVHQNCDRVGELAVETLAGQLHQHIYGVPSVATATLVEGTWFDGASMPSRRAASDRVKPISA